MAPVAMRLEVDLHPRRHRLRRRRLCQSVPASGLACPLPQVVGARRDPVPGTQPHQVPRTIRRNEPQGGGADAVEGHQGLAALLPGDGVHVQYRAQLCLEVYDAPNHPEHGFHVVKRPTADHSVSPLTYLCCYRTVC